MQFDLERFRDVFFQEVEEHLASMESGLLRLEDDSDPELLNEIFRGAHSIKGASGTFGFDEIARFTHALETLLDAMRAGKIAPDRERTAVLLRACDVLRRQVAAVRENRPGPAEAEEVWSLLTVAQRRDWSAGQPPSVRRADRDRDPAGSTYKISFIPAHTALRSGLDPLLLLADLDKAGSLLESVCDVSRLPALAALEPDACYLGWRIRLQSHLDAAEIREMFAFFEGEADYRIDSGQEKARARGPNRPAADSSIRVSTAKVDKLIDLVGEMVIAQSMAAQILAHFELSRLGELTEAFCEMERYTRELQERVMSVRMMPIGSVFSRFPRLVHDAAASLRKQIDLEMTGEETELDKTVVERMADPLTHLIRNAIDHGIEAAGDRLAAGKPECGVIRLRAFHQEGNVQIEVIDDGRGLDLERIRRKAIERELIRESDELNPQQIADLIFEPGLSTAQAISDLSGRGVGMDVVKRKVLELNGSVNLATEAGRGTTVRIKLPLTLAILEGQLVKVGNERYVLPLIAILESIRPRPEHLTSLANAAEMVVVRGEPVPLIRLHRIFGVETDIEDPTRGLVVLMESGGHKLALLVDELLGQQQVVVKSLETNFRKVPGILGATILGDGRAALIIDGSGLVQMVRACGGGIEVRS